MTIWRHYRWRGSPLSRNVRAWVERCQLLPPEGARIAHSCANRHLKKIHAKHSRRRCADPKKIRSAFDTSTAKYPQNFLLWPFSIRRSQCINCCKFLIRSQSSSARFCRKSTNPKTVADLSSLSLHTDASNSGRLSLC